MQEFEVFRCRTCRHWLADPLHDPVEWLDLIGARPCRQWRRGKVGATPSMQQDGAMVDHHSHFPPVTGPDFGCVQHSELQPAEAPPLTPQMRETLDRLNAMVDARRAAGDKAAHYYGSGDRVLTSGYGSSVSIDRLEAGPVRPKK